MNIDSYYKELNDSESKVDFCENYSYLDIYEAIITNGVMDMNNFAKVLTENTARIDDYENVIKTLNSNYKKD